VALLAHKLAALSHAGLTEVRGLELIAGGPGTRSRRVLSPVADALRGGESLGDALRAQGKYFPSFFVESVAIGETTGALERVLEDLAAYYEDQWSIRRAFIRGLMYPLAVLFAACYLIPIMVAVLTSAVGAGSSEQVYRMVVWMVLSLAGQVAAILIVGRVLAHAGVLTWFRGIVGAHLWPLSALYQKFAVYRFLYNLALLLDAGASAVPSIQHAAAAAGIPALERDLRRAVPAVQGGATLAEAFGATRRLPPMAFEMLRVGEQAGSLGDSLRKAAAYCRDEAVHALNVIARVLEAIVIILVAMLLFGGGCPLLARLATTGGLP